MGEFFQRYQRGQTTMTIEFSLYLSECVGSHIRTSDRQLTEYLHEHENGAAIRGQFVKYCQGGLWIPQSVQ
jgi:hypothetical protein